MTDLPFHGLRVVDLTRARAGPAAARQFADWGADVIMVESPNGADDIAGSRESSDFQNLHRNKRSIALDLKSEAGKAAFLDLIATADILLENYRPDVKRRLGIDFETLQRINPRLIYASISGFGQEGPYAQRPGLDPIIQAIGGMMSITGKPGEGPMRVGVAISDMAAGLYCVIATLMALYDRERTGLGKWVRTSLIEAEIAMLDFQAARWLTDRQVPVQEGNHHPTGVPAGLFDTADGHAMIAPGGNAMFGRFARLVGREDWIDDPRFTTGPARYQNRDELRAQVNIEMKKRTTAEWVEVCSAAGIPCGPVNSIDQVFADPQVQLLEMSRKTVSPALGELELVSQPLQFGDTRFEIRTAAPAVGEHMDEVFQSIGYNADQIATLNKALVAGGAGA